MKVKGWLDEESLSWKLLWGFTFVRPQLKKNKVYFVIVKGQRWIQRLNLWEKDRVTKGKDRIYQKENWARGREGFGGGWSKRVMDQIKEAWRGECKIKGKTFNERIS